MYPYRGFFKDGSLEFEKLPTFDAIADEEVRTMVKQYFGRPHNEHGFFMVVTKENGKTSSEYFLRANNDADCYVKVTGTHKPSVDPQKYLFNHPLLKRK